MTRLIISIGLIIFLFSGCANKFTRNSSGELIEYDPIKHERSNKLKFLGCDITYFVSKLDNRHRESAKDNYIYALLASNTYHNNIQFNLNHTYKPLNHYRDDQTGF